MWTGACAIQAQTIQLNRELLAAHLQVFHEAAKLHHFNVEPDLNELLRMPGVLSTETAAAVPDPARGPALEAAVMALAPALMEQLNQVRGVEGAALAGGVAGVHDAAARTWRRRLRHCGRARGRLTLSGCGRALLSC